MIPIEAKQEIKNIYGDFAETVRILEKHDFVESAGYAFSCERYGRAEISSVPPTALRLACGCGNPVSNAPISSGCAVVDLGCGGGIDVILAARRAVNGKVLGIDMVPEMIRCAQQAVAESGLQQHIFFRVADIEDIYPLPKNFADVVLANCVINFCPDKTSVYRNIFRILRPGGVLIISDCVLNEEIEPQVRERLQADRSNCLSGTVSGDEHLLSLRKISFDILETDFFTLSIKDLETIARYPAGDPISPLSREDFLYLQNKMAGMTIIAKRRPLN